MTDPVLLRDAETSDAPALARISVDGWQQAYAGLLPQSYLDALDVDARMRGWLEVLETTPMRPLVAEVAGVVAGFASFGPSRDDDADATTTAEIYAIYVSPDRWRRGIGRDLLIASMAHCAAAFDTCTLWVLTGNESARAFYAAHGFLPDGAAKVESRRGVVLDEVRYRAPLLPQPTAATGR